MSCLIIDLLSHNHTERTGDPSLRSIVVLEARYKVVLIHHIGDQNSQVIQVSGLERINGISQRVCPEYS